MAAKTITIKNKTDKAKLAIAADARNVSPVMIATDTAFAADFGMPAGGVDLRIPVRKESNLEYVTVAPGKSFAYSTESETEIAVFEGLQKKLDSNLFEITIA